MSDSEDEGNLVVDDGSGVDDSICPICRGSTFVGETINCEKCEYWFHFECVGVTHDDEWVKNEDVPYFCSNCGGPKRKIKKKKAKKVSKPPPKPTQISSPPIKLKISLGSLGKKKSSASKIELSPPRQIPNKRRTMETLEISPIVEPEESKKRKRQKSEDEEEKWLDAVESGTLHAVDAELKSIRDPKLMTARQRAMVDRKNNDDFNDEESGHMSLSYTKKCKSSQYVDEEENQRIKAMKSAKRKEIELEKRKQDRINTIEKLLNKQEKSTLKNISKIVTPTIPSQSSPKIIYIQNGNGATLTFPPGFKFPLEKKLPLKPPLPIRCSVKNCKNIKRYNCSKTGKPLCSLQCYKMNLI